MTRLITLQESVEDSIARFPTLYKMKDFKTSKLAVLNHLFLVNGNGYEWDERGFLFDSEDKKLKKLPKDFFEKDTHKWIILPEGFEKVYQLMSDDELKDTGIKKRKGKYYRKQKQAFDDYGGKFGIYPQPYPICQYTCLVNMPDNILYDWWEGSVEVARWAYNFYNTPYLYENSFYWQPAQRKQHKNEEAFKEWETKHLQEQLDYLNKFFVKNNIIIID